MIEDIYKEDKPLLTILIGLPGSVKSKIAKDIAQRDDAVILSLPEYIIKYKKLNKNEIYNKFYQDMNKYLSQKVDIVIDGQNTTIQRRKQILSHIKEPCVKRGYIVNTQFGQCLENLIEKGVNTKILYDCLYKFQIPFYNEGFDFIIVDKEPNYGTSYRYLFNLSLNAEKVLGLKPKQELIKLCKQNIYPYSKILIDEAKYFYYQFNADVKYCFNIASYFVLCNAGYFVSIDGIEGKDSTPYPSYDIGLTLDTLFYVNYSNIGIKQLQKDKKCKPIFDKEHFNKLNSII